MEGSSHTMTTEPLWGDSSMITDTSIPRSQKDKFLDYIKNGTSDQRTSGDIKIPKVPQWLKNEANKKCFEPAVVSIGPYHQNEYGVWGIDNLKDTSARRYVSGCGCSIDEAYSAVESVIGEAKTYYDKEFLSGLNDVEFTILMFLDGCFVLDFIDRIMLSSSYVELFTFGNDILSDLFMLENQLPYPVLKVLMDFKKCPEDQSENMIYSYVEFEVEQNVRMKSSSSGKKRDPFHILDLFLTKLVGDNPIEDELEWARYGLWRSYPPVNQLLDKGITFKTNDFGGLYDIEFKFNVFNGELSLPILEINHFTKDRFLNLIAYELSSNFLCDRAFVSFICFLDTLIDHADDVKLLRSADIIHTCLGSDEEVAKLVNQLAIGLVHNPFAYSKVIHGIHNYCTDKRRVYIGEFVHTHCSNPWKIIALIAACFIIFLTGVQTFFAVFPP